MVRRRNSMVFVLLLYERKFTLENGVRKTLKTWTLNKRQLVFHKKLTITTYGERARYTLYASSQTTVQEFFYCATFLSGSRTDKAFQWHMSKYRGAYALGSIDPSLYKAIDEEDNTFYPEDHRGRIWFAVEYERESEKLRVTLMKARNLPSRVSGNNNGCDPFVRIYLMPDERRYMQSKSKRKTCNPNFEESYVFQVSYKTIQDRTLKLTVFDVDRSKRHRSVGHALYPLKEHDCESNEQVVIWRDLEREVTGSATNQGELHIALTYNDNLERLTVGIFEGKNLRLLDGCSSVDCYVKVSLLQQNKMVKTKKTEVLKRTDCPAFNESFSFKVSPSQEDTTSFSIHAMQHVLGHKDKVIGRVVLGPYMFARGKELEHWNTMIANKREQVSMWHVLT